jgi:hypothetical protein
MSRRPAVLVWLLGTALLVGCTHDLQPTSSTAHEIQEARRRTVPSNGRLIRTAQPALSGFAIRSEWEIQTAYSDNQTYFHWLKNQLGPEYHVTAETASTITFAWADLGNAANRGRRLLPCSPAVHRGHHRDLWLFCVLCPYKSAHAATTEYNSQQLAFWRKEKRCRVSASLG